MAPWTGLPESSMTTPFTAREVAGPPFLGLSPPRKTYGLLAGFGSGTYCAQAEAVKKVTARAASKLKVRINLAFDPESKIKPMVPAKASSPANRQGSSMSPGTEK